MPFVFDPNDVHTPRALERFSVKYMNPMTIWRMLAPIVDVENRSDMFRVYDAATSFRDEVDTLAPDSEANEIEIRSSLDNFAVRDRGLGAWVPVEAIRNSSKDPLRPEQDAIMEIRDSLDNRQEKRVADIVFNRNTYMSDFRVDVDTSDKWDSASSDPLDQLLEAIDRPLAMPNTLVLGVRAWRELRLHPQTAAAIYPMGGNAGAGGSAVTEQAVANYLGLTRVVVGRRRLDLAKPGAANPNIRRIWGNHAALLYVNPTPGLYRQNFISTFVETRTAVVRDFNRKRGLHGSIYVKDGWNEDVQVVAPFAGYFFENVLAATSTE